MFSSQHYEVLVIFDVLIKKRSYFHNDIFRSGIHSLFKIWWPCMSLSTLLILWKSYHSHCPPMYQSTKGTDSPHSPSLFPFLSFHPFFFFFFILSFRGVFKTRSGQLEKALKAGGCTVPVIINAEKVNNSFSNLFLCVWSMLWSLCDFWFHYFVL